MTIHRLAPLALALALTGCGGSPEPADDQLAPAPQPADPAHVAEVDAWHQGRLERLRQPDGWLSLVGLQRLEPGENVIGNGEGGGVALGELLPPEAATVLVDSAGVVFAPHEAGIFTVDGEPVDTPTRLAGRGVDEPRAVEYGTRHFYPIERQGAWYLRVKDSAAPVLREFDTIERWPVDSAWRVQAQWHAYDPPRTLGIPNVQGWSDAETVYGEARFTIGGREFSLVPLYPPDEEMFFIFGDATNGDMSYGAGRFLYAGPVGEDGSFWLDFNRAYNPPCVFTAFATCPLPPEGNTLPFPVPAGEKMWGDAHH